MKNYSAEWLGRILAEETYKDEVDTVVAIMVGRFQPFHAGHYSVYELLAKKFGKNNTYICTSNKTEPGRSPFNFREKQTIISTMFGVPKNKIVQAKNPYVPKEILSKYSKTSTAYVTAFSTKDAGRLGGKYFKPFPKDKDELLPYTERGYFIVAPEIDLGGKSLSGTAIRNFFTDVTNSEDDKKKEFKRLYRKFNPKIYDLIMSKLNVGQMAVTEEEILEFLSTGNLQAILSEISYVNGTNAHVDDGPGAFFPTDGVFQRVSQERAAQIGYTVMDYISNGGMTVRDHPLYPKGPIDAVSYFPAGDYGKLTAMNQEDDYGPEAYDKWFKHVTRAASLVGYEVIYSRAEKQRRRFEKKQSGDQAKRSKNLQKRDTLHEELNELLTDIRFSNDPLDDRILLMCGGAFGHLAHPFDDMNLTFGDMKDMIVMGLSGGYDVVQEKLDGMNLMVTYHDGHVKAARSKTQLRDFGANALDVDAISAKFAGRGDVHDAFTYAMEDLEAAISNLSKSQKEEIFGNGRRYMNLEILYPQTPGTVPYGLNMIVFHGLNEYDQAGNQIGFDKSGAKALSDMIKKINQSVQKTFTLSDNPNINLPKAANFEKDKSRLLGKLKKLQSEFRLRDSDPVLEYHVRKWEQLIQKEAKKRRYNIPAIILERLVDRWARQNKSSFSVNQMKKEIDNESFLEWVLKFDKESHSDTLKDNLMPFELIFLDLAQVVLSGILEVLLVQDGDKVANNLRKEVEATIKRLKSSKDFSTMRDAQRQIEKIEQLGGVESILPTEGIVFIYKDKLYKLTGSFAPSHQLLRM